MTKPNGRRLNLDAKDGVKTWAVRLGVDELSVCVSGVKFFPLDDEDEEGEDKMDVDGIIEARKEEEEEGEDDDKEKEAEAAKEKEKEKEKEQEKEKEKEPEQEPEPPAVKEPPKRGRGRPRKKVRGAKAAEPPSSPAEIIPKKTVPRGPLELQVKLNGGAVQPRAGLKGEWEVRLPVGYNVLEIGEKDGMVWRVYLERMGATAGIRLTE